jgi:hypothetical protein
LRFNEVAVPLGPTQHAETLQAKLVRVGCIEIK